MSSCQPKRKKILLAIPLLGVVVNPIYSYSLTTRTYPFNVLAFVRINGTLQILGWLRENKITITITRNYNLNVIFVTKEYLPLPCIF